jgi:hypothetical protein
MFSISSPLLSRGNMRAILICSKPNLSDSRLLSAFLQWSIRIANEIASRSHLRHMNDINQKHKREMYACPAIQSPIATFVPMPPKNELTAINQYGQQHPIDVDFDGGKRENSAESYRLDR